MTGPVARLWNELTTEELYGFLRLRSDVFLWEQRVDDKELDGRDLEPATVHWWIADDRGVAGYLRVLWDATPEHLDAHRVIGRVAVRADRRGEGLAAALMAAAIARLDAAGEASLLHSQAQVTGLYARFGYVPYGEPYVEAGVPHRSMYRAAGGR